MIFCRLVHLLCCSLGWPSNFSQAFGLICLLLLKFLPTLFLFKDGWMMPTLVKVSAISSALTMTLENSFESPPSLPSEASWSRRETFISLASCLHAGISASKKSLQNSSSSDVDDIFWLSSGLGASLNSRIVFAWANGNGGKFKRFLTEDLSLFSMGIAEVDFLCKVRLSFKSPWVAPMAFSLSLAIRCFLAALGSISFWFFLECK